MASTIAFYKNLPNQTNNEGDTSGAPTVTFSDDQIGACSVELTTAFTLDSFSYDTMTCTIYCRQKCQDENGQYFWSEYPGQAQEPDEEPAPDDAEEDAGGEERKNEIAQADDDDGQGDEGVPSPPTFESLLLSSKYLRVRTSCSLDSYFVGGLFAITSIAKIRAYTYEIKGASLVAALDDITHYGGLYNKNKIEDVISEFFPDYDVRILERANNVAVSGLLDVDTARNNLGKVLVAEGLTLDCDEESGLPTIEPLQFRAAYADEKRIFTGYASEARDTTKKVIVAQHSYTSASASEDEYEDIYKDAIACNTLIDGTLACRIIFGKPYDTSTLRIGWDSSSEDAPTSKPSALSTYIMDYNENMMVIKNRTQVYLVGVPYNDASTELGAESVQEEDDTREELRIDNNGLINASNGANVFKQLTSYAKAPSIETFSMPWEGEKPSDLIDINVGGETKTALISKITITLSSFPKAEVEAIVGYLPENVGETSYTITVLKKEEENGGEKTEQRETKAVTASNVVAARLFGGGYDGEPGANGGSGGGYRSSPAGASYTAGGLQAYRTAAGLPGARGMPGAGGKMLLVTASGTCSNCSFGENGGDTTCNIASNTYNSANGVSWYGGWRIDGKLYGAAGYQGSAGMAGTSGGNFSAFWQRRNDGASGTLASAGAGGGAAAAVLPLQGYRVNGAQTEISIGGTGAGGDVYNDQNVEDYTDATRQRTSAGGGGGGNGGGGGAAGDGTSGESGQPGGDGAEAQTSFFAVSKNPEYGSIGGSGGAGGKGGDAQAGTGCGGGAGGDGGGGGGAGAAPPDSDTASVSIKGGAGGEGGEGGKGGSGCIVCYCVAAN